MTDRDGRSNPFPGLRTFDWDEAHLFFGRDGQSDELLRLLARTHFVAVVGTSGSGKSSLVRAGLVPALAGGFLTSAGSSWRIVLFRPGDAPIDALAAALVAPEALADASVEPALQRAIVGAALRRSPLGLVEIVRQARLSRGENLLLVVDQFEEVFRFRGAAGNRSSKDESAAFVKLILEAARQRELPIYMVLTMRSDFLGECAQFRDLPETLNGGQYLVPRMTRDDRGAAITGPVAVAGGAISPRLVQRLLNDVGDDPDQLPVLQHALMRTWDHWQGHATDGRAIDLEDYEAIGGMAEALSQHADEAYDELQDDTARRLAERLFTALTTLGPNGQVVRRPTSLARLAGIAGASICEVAAVVERFRAPRRSLLMPPASIPLEPSVVVDISHESLIRQWDRLRRWVEEETESRATYLRIVDAAVRRTAGRGGLWRDPDLALALAWKSSNAPNAEWAALYDPSFEPAMQFLEDSRADVAAEQRKSRLQRRALGATLLALIVLLIGTTMVWVARRASEMERREAENQRAIAETERAKAVSAQQAAEVEQARALRLLEETRKQREIATEQTRLAEQRFAEVARANAAVAQQTKRVNEVSAAIEVAQKVIGGLSLDLRPSVVKVRPADGSFYGTAFFVSNSGLLVTAGHVVEFLGDGVAHVDGGTGGGFVARKMRLDKARDLALLAAPSGTSSCLSLADAPTKVGASVIGLGLSPSLEWSPTTGTITAVNATSRSFSAEVRTGLIEANMKKDVGLSGAPVVDAATQRVVGMGAYGGWDSATLYLIPASRIRAAFGTELAAAPCRAK